MLNDIKKYSNRHGYEKITESIRDIDKVIASNSSASIEKKIKLSYPNFIDNIRTFVPDITKGEERLCILIKLDFDSNQISEITDQSKASIFGMLKRLRDKFNLPNNQDLYDLIKSIQ